MGTLRFLSLVLVLAFVVLGMNTAWAGDVTVRVLASDDSPLAGVGIAYGGGTNAGSSWFPGQPTGASGALTATLAPGIYSFRATYNNGTAFIYSVDCTAPTTEVIFRTNEVVLELKNSGGGPLEGGAARYGAGAAFGTSFWPGGNTDAAGQTKGQLFPGTYSFEMAYNGTAQVKGSVAVVVGPNTFTWTTTSVTLQYSGELAFGGGTGDSRFFTKPTMDLLPSTVMFNARPNGRFNLVISGASMTKSIVALKLKDHNGNPLGNGKARGGIGSSYSTWWVPGVTDATYGTVIDLVNGLQTTMSYEMRYNNTTQHKTQNVAVNSIINFQTIPLTLRLETCGAVALDGGTARYGVGANYTTWWFPGGNTGSSAPGQTVAEVFPGTYSFGMGYQGTEEAKLNVVVPDAPTLLTWQTTNVKLNYSGSISFGGPVGDSRWFIKPSMELMPGTAKFHFRGNGGADPGGVAEFTWTGCSFEKTVARLRVVESNGTAGVPGVTFVWQIHGTGVDLPVPGSTNAAGVLLHVMDGYNNAPTRYLPKYLGATGPRRDPLPATQSFVNWSLINVTVKLTDVSNAVIADATPVVTFEYPGGGRQTFGSLVGGQLSKEMMPTDGYCAFFIDNYNDTKLRKDASPMNTSPFIHTFQCGKMIDNGYGVDHWRISGGVNNFALTAVGAAGLHVLPNTFYIYPEAVETTRLVIAIAAGQTLTLNADGPVLGKPGDVSIEVPLPTEFALSQNYPNPFNPSTAIRVDLPVDAKVTLTVYNALGQSVAELMNGTVSAGYHEVRFDATSLASGLYIYRVVAKGADGREFTSIQKMMLMK